MTALRLGIVGCGAVTEHCHLPALAPPEAPFTVTALIDKDLDRARALAERLGGAIFTGTDPEALLSKPASSPGGISAASGDNNGLVDAVLVATGPDSHAELAARFAAAGLPVLLEKPIAATRAECARLRAAGGLVVPAHVRRFYPATPWVRAFLASGRLGRILRVHWREGAAYQWPLASPFAFAPGPGGGVLADLGPHILDLLAYWLGTSGELLSGVDNAAGGAASETVLTLRYAAVSAEIMLSRLRPLSDRVTIEGTAATLSFGTVRAASYALHAPDGTELESRPIPAADPAILTRPGLFRHQLSCFAAAVRAEPTSAATFADAEAVVSLLAQARSTTTHTLAHPWLPAASPRQVAERGRSDSTGRDLDAESALGGMAGLRIAVTGANGFIGGHIVEQLLDAGARAVTAVVRTHAGRARLAHRDPERLRFALADARDATALEAAFRGCDVVVHAVYGSRGEAAERWSVTVDGTAAVLAAATKAGVRRLVYLSSVSVYRPDAGPLLNEHAPALLPAADDQSYAAQKAVAERLLLERAGSGHPAVVCIQPAAVYGPWGPVWTIRPLRRLREDNRCLPSGSGGTCDVVHVYDVARAVAHLVTADVLDGARYLLTGPENTTWGAYYDRYRDLLGLTHLDLPDSPDWPEGNRALFARTTRIDDTRLAATGFRSRITLAAGMDSVATWARWVGLL